MLILPIVVISLIAALARLITKTWISPTAFFSLCWSFFLILPIVFASDYEIDHLALWFIAIFTLSLGSGSIIAYSMRSRKSDVLQISLKEINYKILFNSLLFFSFISLISVLLLFFYATEKYNPSNYYKNWMIISNMIAIDRYNEILNYPLIIKYGLYFIYPSNLLAGLLFGLKENTTKIKIILIIPLILAVLLGIIEGSRTSILLGLILFFSTWLSSLSFRQKSENTDKSIFRLVFLAGGVFILFTIFFILIQWLRQGMDTIIIALLIDRMQAYFFGYLAAFSKWFVELREFDFYSGLITLAGPFNLIGIMERPLGFYSPINISNGISTNIFTAFRGIISDFSISGSIIIAFIIGFVSQIAFQSEKKSTLLSTLPISMFYAFTLYSPLISIFHYNSIFFSWLILIFILIISKHETVDNYS